MLPFIQQLIAVVTTVGQNGLDRVDNVLMFTIMLLFSLLKIQYNAIQYKLALWNRIQTLVSCMRYSIHCWPWDAFYKPPIIYVVVLSGVHCINNNWLKFISDNFNNSEFKNYIIKPNAWSKCWPQSGYPPPLPALKQVHNFIRVTINLSPAARVGYSYRHDFSKCPGAVITRCPRHRSRQNPTVWKKTFLTRAGG